MDKHYVCLGECEAELEVPGVCSDEDCSHYQDPLVVCMCEDGSHDSAGEIGAEGDDELEDILDDELVDDFADEDEVPGFVGEGEDDDESTDAFLDEER